MATNKNIFSTKLILTVIITYLLFVLSMLFLSIINVISVLMYYSISFGALILIAAIVSLIRVKRTKGKFS
jgi:hypothetical protein